MFSTTKILIATQHGKEQVMQPLLEQELGLECFVNQSFDTDVLGTFSGEVEREDGVIETLRKKCNLAMEVHNFTLAIATEGSFGAHPSLFFAAANDELVMLLDKENNIEVIARTLSLETNYNTAEITTELNLIEFSEQAKFPSHAIILQSSLKNAEFLFKGITNKEDLISSFKIIKEKYPFVFVSTDMRAMFNPTRMKVIQETTKKVIQKLKSLCPSCNFPGFDVVEVISGLRCSQCRLPTKSTLSHLYTCKKCAFSETKMYPNLVEQEDPMYCNYCNP
jgi:predicted RNA-binding Zn-ribbon protein involved in translation (DUF1610 family)